MAELGDGGGATRATSNGSNTSSSSSNLNSVSRSDKTSEGTEIGGVTMLGTVDLSGIFSSTPASSSSYKGSAQKPIRTSERFDNLKVVVALADEEID